VPPIKVLHYSSYDIHYGAAIAAHRLHKALQKAGIESKMVVQNKTSDEKSIIGPGNNVEKALGLVRPFIDRFPLMFRAAPKNFSTGWASGRYTKYIEIENYYDKNNKLKKSHFILITTLYMLGSIVTMILAGITYAASN